MPLGYFSLILHAHLPFVRHPEYPEFLEEDWFYEAITEGLSSAYFYSSEIARRGCSSAACDQFIAFVVRDACRRAFAGPLSRHLENLFELAKKEEDRTRKVAPDLHSAAKMYVENLSVSLDLWNNRYNGN
jgi:1,4-alpha-glucan branching enzyme